ncbi:MAG: hypothetical protein J6Y13_10010 [Treponema sp.]|nr:hypothetical protein [Treponema sp.]
MATSPVEHDGKFVLTSSGSRDFGEITPEMAMKIKRESGKIRLETGFQMNGRGFGEAHIERPDRLKQLKSNGFANARDYIEFVANDFDAIYQGKDGNIIITKCRKGANVAFLSLKQDETDTRAYWTVESAFIARADYLNGKTVLWKK